MFRSQIAWNLSVSEPGYLELECFGAKLLEFLSVSEPNCSELECFGAKLLGIRIKYIYIYIILYTRYRAVGVFAIYHMYRSPRWCSIINSIREDVASVICEINNSTQNKPTHNSTQPQPNHIISWYVVRISFFFFLITYEKGCPKATWCLRFYQTILGWKTYAHIIMKLTNSPTQGQPNPQKKRLKSGIWATFSNCKHFFVGCDCFYNRKPNRAKFSANTLE